MKELALQLFSVGSDCAADFEGTLRRVKSIGFTAVEFAGYPLPAQEMKELLEKIGLKPVSSHGNVFNPDAEIPYLKTLGVDKIALPCHSFESHDATLAFAKQVNEAGKIFLDSGIHLSYHNHVQEFTYDPVSGRTFMDLFLENTDPKYVKMQPDMAWVTRSGRDLVEFVTRYRDRILSVHMKDLAEDRETACGLGKGVAKLLEAYAVVPDAQIIVEQDGCDPANRWSDLEQSARFVRSHIEIG